MSRHAKKPILSFNPNRFAAEPGPLAKPPAKFRSASNHNNHHRSAGDLDERLRIEVATHPGIVYFQLMEPLEEGGGNSGPAYGSAREGWFIGRPPADGVVVSVTSTFKPCFKGTTTILPP